MPTIGQPEPVPAGGRCRRRTPRRRLPLGVQAMGTLKLWLMSPAVLVVRVRPPAVLQHRAGRGLSRADEGHYPIHEPFDGYGVWRGFLSSAERRRASSAEQVRAHHKERLLAGGAGVPSCGIPPARERAAGASGLSSSRPAAPNRAPQVTGADRVGIRAARVRLLASHNAAPPLRCPPVAAHPPIAHPRRFRNQQATVHASLGIACRVHQAARDA